MRHLVVSTAETQFVTADLIVRLQGLERFSTFSVAAVVTVSGTHDAVTHQRGIRPLAHTHSVSFLLHAISKQIATRSIMGKSYILATIHLCSTLRAVRKGPHSNVASIG